MSECFAGWRRAGLPCIPLAVLAVSLLSGPRALQGQLISPGRLSAPHADLSGIANCTQCHQLRARGIAEDRCLSCHLPLARRIRDDEGYHATVAAGEACVSCHQEHLGEDFALVQFDTATFEHATVGYELDGAHLEADCRACHAPEHVADRAVLDFKSRNGALDRTFLGLPVECVSCHRSEDPHAGQFEARACTSCHTTATWDEAPAFDHAETRYPLTGLHASVECGACHHQTAAGGAATPFVRYAPLAFAQCTACHADEHDGAMEGICASCHGTSGWTTVDPGSVEGRFEHASTGFELMGAHGRAECVSCHDPEQEVRDSYHLTFDPSSLSNAFPAPVSEDCVSCHLDVHEGALDEAPGGATCTRCHGQDRWIPSAYDLTRHASEARFALEGAHITVACDACHRSEDGLLALEPAFEECTACHQADDPHEGQFADGTCDSCHGNESFLIADFDHSRTEYVLEGEHEDVECAACHFTERSPVGTEFVRYTPLGTACLDCHTEEALQ